MKKRGKKTLMESAADLAESMRPTIESAVETAVETAKDTVDKAAPILAERKEIAKEKARRGGRRAAVKLAAAKAAEPSERLAAFKAAEPKPEKRGRLKKLLLLGGLAGIGSVVFKRLRGEQSTTNWQSSYTPSPAPRHTPTHAATTPAAGAAAADDEGAASPDEALADRSTEPHPDTTPEDPAEMVELRAVEDTAASEGNPSDAASAGGSRKKG
jgi:hypothetical protein